MKPIRVLQVFASLDRGGAESMIMTIYRSIDKNKIQFDFVANNNNTEYAFEKEIKELGGRVFYLPRFNFLNFFSYRKAWLTILKNHTEWQIIHGHHTSPAFIYVNIANSLNRLTIVHSHIAAGNKSIKSFIKILTRYPIRYMAKYRFACSRVAAEWMYGKRGLTDQVINNAIKPERFLFNKQVRKEYRRNLNLEDKFVLGHVGRFEEQKNHNYLIEIFQTAYKKNNNLALILVGDGKLRSDIEKKVFDLGLTSAVHFLGVRPDVPELLQVMDVFVFPSFYEGLPVTLIETQASGLKCFASDTITNEVVLTDLIKFLPLTSSTIIWSDMIIDFLEKGSQNVDRLKYQEVIKKSDYNIDKSSAWLQKFYINITETLDSNR